MPGISSKKYYDTIKAAVEDEHTQLKRDANLRHLMLREKSGYAQFCDLQMAKNKTSASKFKVLEELDRYLIRFEKHFTGNGGKVMWANDAAEAVEKIKNILTTSEKGVLYSSRKILDETGFFNSLKKKETVPLPGITEEIVAKIQEEKYSHQVWNVMDVSEEENHEKLRELFFPEEEVISAKALGRALRSNLIDEISEKDILISEADLLATDTGALVFYKNSGDEWLASARVKKHIVIAGIDRLIPSLEDLDVIMPLHASASGAGEMHPVTVILTSPRKKGELDGPEELIVILVNNGRTDLLANKRTRKILTCIHCGACQNHCPVYALAGVAPYENSITGPYGVVTANTLSSEKPFDHLHYATTLCGKCSDVCPVDINLHEMMVFNRREAIKNGRTDEDVKRFIKAYKFVTASRRRMNLGPASLKNMLLKNHIGNYWGDGRALPKVAPKNFSQLFAEKHRS